MLRNLERLQYFPVTPFGEPLTAVYNRNLVNNGARNVLRPKKKNSVVLGMVKRHALCHCADCFFRP